MIADSALIGTLALVALSALGISLMWFSDSQPIARKASMFLAVPVLLVAAFYMLNLPSLSVGSPFTMNVVSNTIYQNTNSSTLYIYSITHSAPLTAWLGSNTSNMPEVVDERGGSVDVAGVLYSLTGYNMSAVLAVPQGQYYKFNYTDASFVGEYGG